MADTTYRGYNPRPELLPLTRARVDPSKQVDHVVKLARGASPPPVEANAAVPFVGVTTGGKPLPGLFPLEDTGFDPAPAVDAARALLAALPTAERLAAERPVADRAWRRWTNAYPSWEPHGVYLDDLDEDRRAAAVGLLRASLSPQGFGDVRRAMRLNGALGRLINQYAGTLEEWAYWITIFGTPSADEPWGWQLFGHHICVSCFIVARQMVLTPTFLGAEFESQELFDEHRVTALELMADLTPAQRERAVLYPSMRPDDLPAELAGPVDGRHLGGAGQDNRVIPYAGLAAEALSAAQQDLLVRIVDSFVARLPAAAAAAKLAEVRAHLDDTHFAWIGTAEEDQPFYYRVHSPVVLTEYDNHPGIFLDFDLPEPFHVHTVVRTPNGNDYGRDLLRQHYEHHHLAVPPETGGDG